MAFEAPPVAGFGLRCPWLHLLGIAVDAQNRRRGLAQHLLRAALRGAAEAGASAALLHVRVENHAAQRLYRRLGAWGWMFLGVGDGWVGPGYRNGYRNGYKYSKYAINWGGWMSMWLLFLMLQVDGLTHPQYQFGLSHKGTLSRNKMGKPLDWFSPNIWVEIGLAVWTHKWW